MSLDVYLTHTDENGDEQFFYEANITHNLSSMAIACGLYEAVWTPDKIKAKQAKDIIEPLKSGLGALKRDPEWFKQYNSSNGWGLYKNFVPWLEEYLEACEEFPEAVIEVWK